MVIAVQLAVELPTAVAVGGSVQIVHGFLGIVQVIEVQGCGSTTVWVAMLVQGVVRVVVVVVVVVVMVVVVVVLVMVVVLVVLVVLVHLSGSL